MAGRLQKYTRIKNEVLEMLAHSRLTARQFKIILLIIRESWGWNAGRSNWTHKPLSITEIAQRTGISRKDVVREIKLMIDNNILQKLPQKMGANYSFNEHQNTWQKPLKRGKTPQEGCGDVTAGGKPPHLSAVTSPHPRGVKHRTLRLRKSVTTRVFRILNKDLKKDLKKKEKMRDPENFFMTPGEVEKVMACSPEARELAKLFWDESKRRGATGFPDGFFWKCVVCFDKLLKRGTKEEIARCMLDLFDDGYTIMDSPYKVSDKFAAWQIKQKSGGWNKRTNHQQNKSQQDPLERPVPPSIEDQDWFKELQDRERNLQS